MAHSSWVTWGAFNSIIQEKGSFLFQVWRVLIEELRVYPAVGRTGVEKVGEAVPDRLRLRYHSEWFSWAPREAAKHLCLLAQLPLGLSVSPFSSVFQISLVLLISSVLERGLWKVAPSFWSAEEDLEGGSSWRQADHSAGLGLFTQGEQGWGHQWRK